MDCHETPVIAKDHKGRKRKKREGETEERSNKRGRAFEVAHGSSRITIPDSSIQKGSLDHSSNPSFIPSPNSKTRDDYKETKMNRFERSHGCFDSENYPSRIASTYEKINISPGRPNDIELERVNFPVGLGRTECEKEKERRYYDQKEDTSNRGDIEASRKNQALINRGGKGVVEHSNNRSSPPRSTPDGLYGDLVSMCTGLVIIPDMGRRLYQVMQEDDHPKRDIAPYVYFAANIPTLVYYPIWISWFLNKGMKNPNGNEEHRDLRLFASRVAFVGCVSFNAFMNIVDWPQSGECTITPMFQGGVIMAVLANVSLGFREKIIRLVILFIVGSLVSIHSPYSVYTEDTLPILGGTVLLACFGLYWVQFGLTRGVASVLLARLFLAAIYIHHIVSIHLLYDKLLKMNTTSHPLESRIFCHLFTRPRL